MRLEGQSLGFGIITPWFIHKGFAFLGSFFFDWEAQSVTNVVGDEVRIIAAIIVVDNNWVADVHAGNIHRSHAYSKDNTSVKNNERPVYHAACEI